jgi:purine-nucleoside phosphorylase
MGHWAKSDFGREKLGNVGIIIAGTSNPEIEKKTLKMFDEKLTSNDVVYHAYLARKGKKDYPLVFNVLGAPAAVDVLSVLKDGGCSNVIFIGFAYGGFKDLELGDIVVPSKSYHFDGLFHAVKLDKDVSLPDSRIRAELKKVLHKEKIRFIEGANISVPAVTLQPKHNNNEYKRIKPTCLEMEFAAFLSRAKEIGIRAAGVMIISDNRHTSLNDLEKRKARRHIKEKIIGAVVKNIISFDLKPLKGKENFNIDSYLADIIEMDDDGANVYRKGSKMK